MTTTTRMLIPLTFWLDHADRCPCDDPETGMCTEVRTAGSRALIEGTAAQIEVLRSDAEFYAQGNVDDCPAVVRSAKLTLLAIEAAKKPLDDRYRERSQ